MKRTSMGTLFVSLLFAASAACSDDNNPDVTPDAAPIDSPAACDPATVLPMSYRPIPMTSAGLLTVTNVTGAVTTATVDATAGGVMAAADNPYIYVDLKAGAKVAISDLDARTSTAWDIALKRSSVRANGGDSGAGGRQLSVVQAAEIDTVTAVPGSGYTIDEFADDNCAFIPGQIGEPMSAFGNWYDYDVNLHTVTAKSEVYVVKRPDGSHTAVEIVTYYRDPTVPSGGAFYTLKWKQL